MTGLSVYGYVFYFLWTLTLAVTLGSWWVAAALIYVVITLPFTAKSDLRDDIGDWRIWVGLSGILIVTPLVIGEKDLLLPGLPISISTSGLYMGMQMALRALAIVVAVLVFSRNASISELSQLFERLGVRGLGFAFGVAMNVLPIIQSSGRDSFNALRLRGGFKHHRWRAMHLLAINIMVNSLRHGEAIVAAAESRAFDVNRPRQLTIALTRIDRTFMVSSVLFGAIVWGLGLTIG